MRSRFVYATAVALAAQVASVMCGQPLTIEAESGVISAPFTVTNGYVYQSLQTGVTNGGRAVYEFTITNAGKYAILATVQAPDAAANSFFVGIDQEPQDPASVWEFPAKSEFAKLLVTSRGDTSPSGHAYALSEGKHQLIIRGSGANARLDRLSIVRVPESPPAPPANLRIVVGP
jgi:hypothetical protein